MRATQLEDLINGLLSRRGARGRCSDAPERIGVLLVNLGTPDFPSYFAVQRYLREFLSDRRVINTSRLIWLPLLYGLILPFRPMRTARKYRKIWLPEGSPLAVYSKSLSAKVGAVLQARFADQVCVELAMTYGNPSITRALESLSAQNVRKLLVLPLYPQYCSSTTGSVFDRTAGVLQRWRWLPETRFVNDYYHDAGYIEALTSRILEPLGRGRRALAPVVLLSWNPAAYVAEGDPYQAQAEATTRLVVSRLGLAPDQWSHCYQSRFGSVEWLQPYTEDTLEAVGQARRAQGDRGVAVICGGLFGNIGRSRHRIPGQVPGNWAASD